MESDDEGGEGQCPEAGMFLDLRELGREREESQGDGNEIVFLKDDLDVDGRAEAAEAAGAAEGVEMAEVTARIAVVVMEVVSERRDGVEEVTVLYLYL